MVRCILQKRLLHLKIKVIGVLNGIRALLEELGVAPDCVTGVAHGTTVATNTLLERNGAVTALITTKGFRDVLDIGRQSRPELMIYMLENQLH